MRFESSARSNGESKVIKSVSDLNDDCVRQ